MVGDIGAGRLIRSAEAADLQAIARVHVESWRTTYAGLLPDGYLASLDAAENARRWGEVLYRLTRQEVLLVAEEHGQVVGFAYGGPEREGDRAYRGELYAIYLIQRAQGQGFGRALVETVAAHLVEQAVPSMLVWVLRDNAPARAFYEHLGGVYLRERLLAFEGVRAPEAAYGWSDAAGLARRA